LSYVTAAQLRWIEASDPVYYSFSPALSEKEAIEINNSQIEPIRSRYSLLFPFGSDSMALEDIAQEWLTTEMIPT